ncbi:cupredoxin domain-containing protein [Rummeliibacillus stabekisii]|uniref:cupredoxin domain-containing protein n=1 Tax=Rummeliibacillus stabekisii TaxID=241244 RepID=UPI00371697DA
MIYIFSFSLILILTIYVIYSTYRAKSYLTEMTAMMIAMAVSMMTSLLIGTILGIILVGKLTTPVIFSVLSGMIIGYIIGRPFSLLASLDGLLAGIMGGMMGAMLGVMVFSQDPGAMMLFADAIFIVVMILVVKLINQELKGTEKNTLSSRKNNLIKPFLYIVTLLLIVSALFFQPISHYFRDLMGDKTQVSADTSTETTAVQAEQKQDYQEAVIMVEQFGYTPENVKVKVGIPVKLHFQKDFKGGCLSFLSIKELELEKTLVKGDNLVEFTPDKPGVYTFYCGMKMYSGKIIVEE